MLNVEDEESLFEKEPIITWYAYVCPNTGREYFFEPLSGVTSWVNPIKPSVYFDFAPTAKGTPLQGHSNECSKKTQISSESQADQRTLLIFSSTDGIFHPRVMERRNYFFKVFAAIASVICFNSICLAIFVTLFETPSTLMVGEMSDKESILRYQLPTNRNNPHVDNNVSNNAILHQFEEYELESQEDKFNVISIFTGESGKDSHCSVPYFGELLSKTNNISDKVYTDLKNQGSESTKPKKFDSLRANCRRKDNSMNQRNNDFSEDDFVKGMMATQQNKNYVKSNDADRNVCDSIQSVEAETGECSIQRNEEHTHDSIESNGINSSRTENDEMGVNLRDDATVRNIGEPIDNSVKIADASIAERTDQAEPDYNYDFSSPIAMAEKENDYMERHRTISSEKVGNHGNNKTPHSCWIPFAYMFNQQCRVNPLDGTSAKLFDAEKLALIMME